MKKKYIIITGCVLVLTFGSYFLFFGGKSKQDSQPGGQVRRIVKVTRGDLVLNISSNGVVQPINKVEIRSKAGGKIVQLNFIEGQYVKQGDQLILVDQTITKNSLDQANADLETSKASLLQAQNTSKRTLELFSKGLVSQQEVDQSNTDLVRAQAQLVKANASLSNAEDQMNDTRIVAPVSGIVLSKNVELGQLISSAMSNVGGGTLLATVADMNDVYAYAKVDEVDIGKVKAEQKVSIIADAYPEDTFEGKVERIAPQGLTQQNVTTFDVVILVRNEGLKLKAGMSTSVDIHAFNRKNVLLLPNEALKDPKDEQGKILMESANLKIPESPSERNTQLASKEKDSKSNIRNPLSGDVDPQKMREKFQKMSPDEREKMRQNMRERIEKMSPEEREKMFSQMRQSMPQGGGGFAGGGGGGGGPMMFGGEAPNGTQKVKRQSQVANENEIRWRVVVVKDSISFTPRLVKTGASNFDNTEIVGGLKEGDEIQITTISRAKIASEQMTARMKSVSSPLGGGMTGGRPH